MVTYTNNFWTITSIYILLVVMGCNPPKPAIDYEEGVGTVEDIATLQSIIEDQGEKITIIEKELIKYKGVIKEKREDRIVANQFNILIPEGIAIIDVEKVR